VCVCVCSLHLYAYMHTASQEIEVRRRDKGQGKQVVEAVGSLHDFVAELLGHRSDPTTLAYAQWKQKVVKHTHTHTHTHTHHKYTHRQTRYTSVCPVETKGGGVGWGGYYELFKLH
jgi:hypothetical protein